MIDSKKIERFGSHIDETFKSLRQLIWDSLAAFETKTHKYASWDSISGIKCYLWGHTAQ